jgi:hypothetical protein
MAETTDPAVLLGLYAARDRLRQRIGPEAYVGETRSPDGLRWTATFVGSVSHLDDSREWDRQDAPLDAALQWARGQADTVRLKVGEVIYSAGRRSIPDLPQWDDNQVIEPRDAR